MSLSSILVEFLDNMRQTSFIEYLAVFTGIASVWYSRKENILVFPTGLVNTVLYVYISLDGHLFGEASVNLYYTIMNIYGWILWSRKDAARHHVLTITRSSAREWRNNLLFFGLCYVVIFGILSYLKKAFAPDAIPWADAFASATAFTGMYLMTKKKLENWYYWILTNIASIPLYFVKHYVFTSVYYVVLLVMAFWGLAEWNKRMKQHGVN